MKIRRFIMVLFIVAVGIFMTTELESYPKKYEDEGVLAGNSNAAESINAESVKEGELPPVGSHQTYHSKSWDEFINELPEVPEEEKRYPKKFTLTPKTMRNAIEEYYMPGVAEGLNVVVDYYERIETWDNEPLHRYNLDLAPKLDDKAIKLIWKGKF